MTVAVPDPQARGYSKVVTTSRKGKKKTATAVKPSMPRIGKQKRVFVHRRALKYMISPDDPGYAMIMSNKDDKFRFYGTTLRSVAMNQWLVKLDMLPAGQNEVQMARKTLSVVEKHGEEPPYDPTRKRDEDIAEECATIVGESTPTPSTTEPSINKKINYPEVSEQKFLDLSTEDQGKAETFVYKYGAADDQEITWRILAEDQQITEDLMVKGLDPDPFKIEIPWVSDTSKMDYNSIWLDNFLPSMKGKAKVLDDYLSRDQSTYKTTVLKDGIRFRVPEAEDEDERVSVHYLSAL